ncbi:helix-turn-helix domain-containing protein [Poriferisphaera sp. WC338]|uniref:helix-turn-helix domain-containing protein n=1 Tax=Poriferisphaera sp. WC338 TaxID=3425129 RepID=UPI003D81A053
MSKREIDYEAMGYKNPQEEVVAISTKDPAPALTRGLVVLRLLGHEGSMTLAEVATKTGWPKSSLMRLLQSLTASGVVDRDGLTRRYHAVVRLIPTRSEVEELRRAASGRMTPLSEAIGHTVELHHFDGYQLEMIDRCEPRELEVSARARIGFKRDLREVDALTQIVKAYGSPSVEWPTDGYWAWQDGDKQQVDTISITNMTQTVHRTQIGIDLGYNYGGVMRIATPVLGANGKLVGVLAVALVHHPHKQKKIDRIKPLLIKESQKISDRLESKTF